MTSYWGLLNLKINQSTFIRNFIEDEAIQEGNRVSTTIKVENFIKMLGKDDYKKVDLKTYQSLISKLMYLS